MDADRLLRAISKEQNLGTIAQLVEDADFGRRELSFTDKLLLLNLRALTDKGFKAVASMLSQEYFSGEDLDGDGKVYGVDFHCADDEANIPILLRQIDASGGEALTWKQIVARYEKA